MSKKLLFLLQFLNELVVLYLFVVFLLLWNMFGAEMLQQVLSGIMIKTNSDDTPDFWRDIYHEISNDAVRHILLTSKNFIKNTPYWQV